MTTRGKHSVGKTKPNAAAKKPAGVTDKAKKAEPSKPHKPAASKAKAKRQGQATANNPGFEKGSYDPGVIKTGTDINNGGI